MESNRWEVVLKMLENIMAELDEHPSRADATEWDARAAIHEAHEKVAICAKRMKELEIEDLERRV